MNATGMLKIVVVLLGVGLSGGVASPAAAQAPANSTAAAPLTRKDVDRLLVEARSSIEAGDLAKASDLITRAEKADIRYPLFHFGDTPSSLRRELMRAQSGGSESGGVTNILRSGNDSADPDPFAVPGPNLPGASKINDPAVTPATATATSPYGNFREEVPGALPAPGTDGASAATSTSEVPDRYPTTDSGTDEPRQSARYDLRVQTATSSASGSSSLDRYATPSGMMSLDGALPEKQLNESSQLSELRFAQLGDSENRASADVAAPTGAQSLLEAGEQALRNRDRERALELFQEANNGRESLAADAQQRLDSHLRMLDEAPEPLDVAPQAAPVPSENPGLVASDGEQEVLARQLSSDVGRIQTESRKIREKDPKQSLRMLQEIRNEVSKSQLKEEFKRQLLRRVDLTITETEEYIQANRADLELDERNREILAEIDRRSKLKLEMQTKIAELVNQYNKLRDEQRFHEMEQVAQRLREMAPDEQVVQQVWENAKFIRRNYINSDVRERKEGSYWQAFDDVQQASVHTTHDGAESVYPKDWADMTAKRRGSGEQSRRRSPKELEIEHSLRKPVLIRYQDEPLSAVIEDLSKATGVNMVLDLRGLNQEGVSSDTRVSLNINSEISLKSALNLILEPLHLSYVVKDEVLKVTSEQLRDNEIYSVVYNVADLVVPIPNFVPDNNIGLQGLINDAHAAMGYGGGALGSRAPMAFVNARDPHGAGGEVPPTALAQAGLPGTGAGIGSPTSLPIGGGPGGLGGAANADFDSLMDLIISTVASDTWVENGGPEAEIRPFPTNLSLVISQTQDVHEEIADLLEQLRRLQDLQVTIEVRFIRLNDSFFEQIGIDFDMNIENNNPPGGSIEPGEAYEGQFPSSVVGMVEGEFPNFTNDLDIPFRQNSFGLAVPQFGTPMDVATFGFAILSDIEAYFLINASQGDRRSNVLNAPKVTLFNGQQAFVADTSQTPFVISVIPVVGEFAAAQQPVIVVLSEGTLMTIQAVVSEDRRYVRLTVVPFFSEIGDVQEFTFEGTTSTSTSSSTTDDDEGNTNSESNDEEVIRSGTTVQLPTFQFVSVTTTVSVPDGGTVLLGGIKRLNEGRNEFGVPLLSKMPYINRLFRNVGIGRETDSLMMMVTPRIIIQEEEEARLLGTPIP